MVERYLEQAEDAERLARAAANQLEREACLQIAALWRRMAADASASDFAKAG